MCNLHEKDSTNFRKHNFFVKLITRRKRIKDALKKFREIGSFILVEKFISRNFCKKKNLKNHIHSAEYNVGIYSQHHAYWQKFRESKVFNKELLWQNIFSLRVNFWFYHTVLWNTEFLTIYSYVIDLQKNFSTHSKIRVICIEAFVFA